VIQGNQTKLCIVSNVYNITLQEQLKLGVRYIDLRVYYESKSKTMYLVHSFKAGELFKELESAQHFVDKFPTEIIILDMNHIYKSVEIQPFSCFLLLAF
jgi:hypothetical protein